MRSPFNQRTKCRAVSITDERCEGKSAPPTLCGVLSGSLVRSGKVTRLERDLSAIACFLDRPELIPAKCQDRVAVVSEMREESGFGKRHGALNPCLVICITPRIQNKVANSPERNKVSLMFSFS